MYADNPVTVHWRYKGADQFRSDLHHEIAHLIDKRVGFSDSSIMQKEWDNAVKLDGWKYPTKYAETTNSTEDFADSFRIYLQNKKAFKEEFPNRAKFLEKIIRQLSEK